MSMFPLLFASIVLPASAQQHMVLSAANDGTPGNDATFGPVVVSADGRYAAFASDASNLVPNDTNDRSDVFRVDLINGGIERVNLPESGGETDGHCGRLQGPPNAVGEVDISGDGNRIVFTCSADNLLDTPDDDIRKNVYLVDVSAGSTTWVSRYNDTLIQGGDNPMISDDGGTVVFESTTFSMTSGSEQFGNADSDVFAYDVAGDTHLWISSIEGLEAEPGGDSFLRGVGPDGTHIAYITESAGLDPLAQLNSEFRTIVYTGFERPGSFFYEERGRHDFSEDNETWAYTTAVSSDPDDDDDAFDVYLEDRNTGDTILASFGGDVGNSTSPASFPALSADGEHVAFQMAGSFFDGVGSGSNENVFVFHREDGLLDIANAGTLDSGFVGYADRPDISGDGMLVVYRSNQNDLVDGVGGTQAWASLLPDGQADLSVSQTIEPLDSDTARITATVMNNGPDDLISVGLVWGLDAGGVIDAVESNNTSCDGVANEVTCVLSMADPFTTTLPAGESFDVVLLVSWTEVGTKDVEVFVLSDFDDPDLSNNNDADEFEVTAPIDLSLEGTVVEGYQVTHTIRNVGDTACPAFTLTSSVTLAPSMLIEGFRGEVTDDGGLDCAVEDIIDVDTGAEQSDLVCTGVDLAPGQSRVVSVEYTTSEIDRPTATGIASVQPDDVVDDTPEDNGWEFELLRIPNPDDACGCAASSIRPAGALGFLLPLFFAARRRHSHPRRTQHSRD